MVPIDIAKTCVGAEGTYSEQCRVVKTSSYVQVNINCVCVEGAKLNLIYR